MGPWGPGPCRCPPYGPPSGPPSGKSGKTKGRNLEGEDRELWGAPGCSCGKLQRVCSPAIVSRFLGSHHIQFPQARLHGDLLLTTEAEREESLVDTTTMTTLPGRRPSGDLLHGDLLPGDLLPMEAESQERPRATKCVSAASIHTSLPCP